MMAAAPMPLMVASRHDRSGSEPAQAPGIRLNGLSAGLAGGRVLGTQLRQALLLGRKGGFEGVRQLGVVHRHNPEASLQLDHLHLSSGQLEIDRFCHFLSPNTLRGYSPISITRK